MNLYLFFYKKVAVGPSRGFIAAIMHA